MDLMTRLALLQQGVQLTDNTDAPNQAEEQQETPEEEPTIYNIAEDIKYVLRFGSYLGYHFITLFTSAVEFRQLKLDSAYFNHLVLFRIPRADAVELVPSYTATLVSTLTEHCYRYTNRLDSLTFRPFLHPGITFDGWRINKNGKIEHQETEDYLL